MIILLPPNIGMAETHQHTPMNTGFLGLNTIPTARMDKTGTIRAGTSTLDPYVHAYIGLQLTDFLSINIRQTAETSNPIKKATALYPGTDIKLRLLKENAIRPEIAIGAQSAFGHKRMAAEFIALSKRHNNFDFTIGAGWGRYATAKHFKNPLTSISNHFKQNRNINDEHPNTPENWFTGEHIGIFGGIEYFTPVKGLSLKLDYGSDRYTAETQSFNYNPPAPWSIGLSYSPNTWVNAGIAMQGTDKIMGRLSLRASPDKWPFQGIKYDAPEPFYKHRKSSQTDITKIVQSAENNGIELENIHASRHTFFAEINIPDGANTPQHIGRALRDISRNAGPEIEEFIITPRRNQLRGTTVKIMRSSLEKALKTGQGSPEEIWNNTEFASKASDKEPLSPISWMKTSKYSLVLENQLSLSEEDTGHLYRSSLLLKQKTYSDIGIIAGTSLRLNISDNLHRLDNLRPQTSLTVKSDENAFTQERISVDNMYIGYTHSLTSEIHAAVTTGHLEEFYAGLGGEILYHPFSSRFAIGAEIWRVNRRAPHTFMNAGIIDNATTTGHINAWYDLPKHRATLTAHAGRFLAGDTGFGLGLEKRFKNGAILDTSFTVSNEAELDIFGGTTHAQHKISLTLPLGSAPYIPAGSQAKTTIAPFGRNIAQKINKPFNLYDETEGFSLKHIADHWDKILD